MKKGKNEARYSYWLSLTAEIRQLFGLVTKPYRFLPLRETSRRLSREPLPSGYNGCLNR